MADELASLDAMAQADLQQIAIGDVLRRGDLCDHPSVIRDFQGEDKFRPYQEEDLLI